MSPAAARTLGVRSSSPLISTNSRRGCPHGSAECFVMVDEALLGPFCPALVRNDLALPVLASHAFHGVEILPDRDHHDLVVRRANALTRVTALWNRDRRCMTRRPGSGRSTQR